MCLLHKILSYSLILFQCCSVCLFEEYCTKDEVCEESLNSYTRPRYLLYDVNHPEGFNLRRDVYMRLAIFIHSLKIKGGDWHLVLPPWHRLYHWKTTDIDQNSLPWSSFFDIESMQRFAPVMEFSDFLNETKNAKIDKIYYLQHYKDAFSEPNWDWTDRWSFTECDENVLCRNSDCGDSSYKYDGTAYRGWFWGYKNISSASIQCVSFQGPASLLKDVLGSDTSLSSYMVDHAEVVVHDTFGDSLYWKCRRSMRFAKHLVEEADIFRALLLKANDPRDHTVRPEYWENEKPKRNALGGPYVCAHLRRADFLHGRSNQVPSIKYAAEQIRKILQSTKLEKVFLASDATSKELSDLIELIKPWRVYNYKPNWEYIRRLKDGGVAIIDQIICSYARYFIGTHESTFTFRIQEEREIIGFLTNTTFNLFCAAPGNCFESSKWTIVF